MILLVILFVFLDEVFQHLDLVRGVVDAGGRLVHALLQVVQTGGCVSEEVIGEHPVAVSYTHLTLPTILLV